MPFNKGHCSHKSFVTDVVEKSILGFKYTKTEERIIQCNCTCYRGEYHYGKSRYHQENIFTNCYCCGHSESSHYGSMSVSRY